MFFERKNAKQKTSNEVLASGLNISLNNLQEWKKDITKEEKILDYKEQETYAYMYVHIQHIHISNIVKHFFNYLLCYRLELLKAQISVNSH